MGFHCSVGPKQISLILVLNNLIVEISTDFYTCKKLHQQAETAWNYVIVTFSNNHCTTAAGGSAKKPQ